MADEPNLEKLVEELMSLGYHQGEIRRIFREITGAGRLTGSAPDEEGRMREVLESYILFARKCWKGKVPGNR